MASARIDDVMLAQVRELLGSRFGELIERYIHDGQRRVDLLRTAVATHNFNVIYAESHGLKGSSRNIGANLLGDLCDELEICGREQQCEEVATLFAALEQEFAVLSQELKVIIAN